MPFSLQSIRTPKANKIQWINKISKNSIIGRFYISLNIFHLIIAKSYRKLFVNFHIVWCDLNLNQSDPIQLLLFFYLLHLNLIWIWWFLKEWLVEVEFLSFFSVPLDFIIHIERNPFLHNLFFYLVHLSSVEFPRFHFQFYLITWFDKLTTTTT